MEKTLKASSGPVKALEFVSDHELAIGKKDGSVDICDIPSGSKTETIHAHKGQVLKLKLFYKGVVISSGEDGFVRVWMIKNGQFELFQELDFCERAQIISSRYTPNVVVQNFALHPTAAQLILLPDGPSPLPAHIWGFGSDQFFMLGGTEQIPCKCRSAAYSPSGNYAATSSGQVIYLYNLDNGKVVRFFGGIPEAFYNRQLQGVQIPFRDEMSTIMNTASEKALGWHSQTVTCIQFSPSEKSFLTGSADKTVRLWDLSDALKFGSEKPVVFNFHNSPIHSISFLGNDHSFVSASTDGTVCIWETQTKAVIKKFQLPNKPILSFAVSAQFLAAGSSDGTIQIWDI